MAIIGYLLSAIVGAGAMYMLDPRMGNRRRALLRDKLFHYRKEAEHAVEDAGGTARHMRNIAYGKQHEAADMVRNLDPRGGTAQ